MNEKKREGTFIPCGDSMEKMDEIRDDELENISGGAGTAAPSCPKCGSEMLVITPLPGTPAAENMPKYICKVCRYTEW